MTNIDDRLVAALEENVLDPKKDLIHHYHTEARLSRQQRRW